MQTTGTPDRVRARALLRRLPSLLLACLLCLHAPSAALAARATLSAAAGRDLAQLIDATVITQLYLYDIPGATVALVGNGRVLHIGGYGYADRATRTPVRADRTLFDAGSVSKLLTATAVLQLAGQGKLDLHHDVNDYLAGLHIPATWPQPVTLADLLTHTAGFEERMFGFYARSPAELTSLQMFLARHLPARVYAPGRVSAYSNYGMALAGQLVARVAGMPFEHYIETAILEPLGMHHSSFRQPLPAPLAAELATGYRGDPIRSDISWYQARPSAALRTTAADMAHLMLAHLQQGRYRGTRILTAQDSDGLLQRQFTNHPAVGGLTYGYQELQRGGQRILWQPGDTRYFTSAVFLLPEQGLGLFVAHNRAGTRMAQLELLDAILARLQPVRPPPAVDSGSNIPPGTRLDGSYRSSRSGVFDLERLIAPFRTVHVRTVAPGALHITGLSMAQDSTWIEQSPGIYRDSGSDERVVFSRDGSDDSLWLFEGNVPAMGYFRLPWHATPAVQGSALAGFTLAFLAIVSLRPPRSARVRSALPYPAPWTARVARPLAGLLGATCLACLAGIALLISQAQQLLLGIPPFIRAILLLPLACAALTAALAILTAIAWRRRYWSVSERWQLTLVTTVGALFLGLLYYWRLL